MSPIRRPPSRALTRLIADEPVALTCFLVFALVPLAALAMSEGYLLSLFARLMIFAVAALSLDLLVGYGGLISFGHAAFIGLGAYAVGILSAHGVRDALLALPAGVLVSALFALATG